MGNSQSLDRIRSIDSKEFSESVEGRTGIEKQLTMEADLMHCGGTTLLSVVRTECPSLSESESGEMWPTESEVRERERERRGGEAILNLSTPVH